MTLKKSLKVSSIIILALTLVCSLLTSCKTLEQLKDTNLGLDQGQEINEEELPKWTITVNELVKYPRATLGEEEIPTFNGGTVWVRRHYEFNSKSVENIVAVPTDNPAEFNLQLKLDKHGSLIAMRLCNDKTHPPWGIAIDGTFYKTVSFSKVQTAKTDDYSEIIINGPFSKELTDAIVKYSEANYNHFHPNDQK